MTLPHGTEGVQSVLPQNVLRWHQDSFKLKAIFKKTDTGQTLHLPLRQEGRMMLNHRRQLRLLSARAGTRGIYIVNLTKQPFPSIIYLPTAGHL